LPIQYALTHPERLKTEIEPLRLEKVGHLEFSAPHFSRFPCLKMALEAGRRGGTAPAALSASNEESVQAFIQKKISFNMIPEIVRAVSARHKMRSHPTLIEILEIDAWARQEARRII